MRKVAVVGALATALLFVSAHAQSPAWTEAKANVQNAMQQPSLLDGPRATLTEAERLQGHHGPVEIEGILGVDGKLHEVRVRHSSKAAAVDELALAAATASTFTPAKDANGVPIPVIIAVPYSLSAYKSATGGADEYRCAQFVRDMDWWKSVNPDRPFAEHELYKMQIGLFLTPVLLSGGMSNPEIVRTARSDFENVWTDAISRCRKKPKSLQKDIVFR